MKIKIEKLIFEGYGLGREESGKPIFVLKSVPGDLINVELNRSKKSFSKGSIKEVLEKSPDRINPVCSSFDSCGGCEHQNISYENQLKYKADIINEIIKRAKLDIQPERIIAGSKKEIFYRNIQRFFMETDKEGNLIFTMHHFDYQKGTVPIQKCFLQSELSNKIMNEVQKIVNGSPEDKKKYWQLRIREGKFTNETMVEFITKNNNLPNEKKLIESLKQFPQIKSIYHTICETENITEGRRRLIYGTPIIYEKIGKYTFQISPESFFQTNSYGVETLYNAIKEMAKIEMRDRILDLYCGTGTIGIWLSVLAKEIVGIEIVPEAIRDAIDNAKINHINNCKFIHADATKWLKDSDDSFDIIIVDPPRSGLNKELIESISTKKFKKLVYVSCNPATFIRDAINLERFGLKLEKLQPIDMFPQTHHIECIGLIKPTNKE